MDDALGVVLGSDDRVRPAVEGEGEEIDFFLVFDYHIPALSGLYVVAYHQ
jgi:hypothetical protein